jgi:hypothetical protein
MWPFSKSEKVPYDANRKKDGRTKSGFSNPKPQAPKMSSGNRNVNAQLRELEKEK